MLLRNVRRNTRRNSLKTNSSYLVYSSNITSVTWLIFSFFLSKTLRKCYKIHHIEVMYEGWNFNSDNYLFTTDTK